MKSERTSNPPELLDASSTSLGRTTEVDQLVSLQEIKRSRNYQELKEIKMEIMNIIQKCKRARDQDQETIESCKRSEWKS